MDRDLIIQRLSSRGHNWLAAPPEKVIQAAMEMNPWFTQEDIRYALSALVPWTEVNTLKSFCSRYNFPAVPENRCIGMILAGNIPGAGFHDVIMGLFFSGRIKIRCSHLDAVLIPAFIEEVFPEASNISFTSDLSQVDGVIASGSSLTAQYLDSYFQDIPRLLRGNRFSVVLLDGTETSEVFQALAKDILLYNGMGCRNISNLLVPAGWEHEVLLRASLKDYRSRHPLSEPYLRKVQWEKGIEQWKGKEQDADLPVCIREADSLMSVETGVLQVVRYETLESAMQKIEEKKFQIQCIIGKDATITPGDTQSPQLEDFADDIDTLAWMLKLPHPHLE